MRTLGLIGGMSWESTAEYYRLLNEGVRDRLGGLHSARLVLASVDFAEIEELQVTGQWDRAAELLVDRAVALQNAGADAVLLCTNTMHKVAEPIISALSVPFRHLGDATAAAVLRRGLTKVGLLGTAFTVEQAFYRDRLIAHGLEVLVPDAAGRALVHRVIYDELCLGVAEPAGRDAVQQVIDAPAQRGAQGIVLGCTELELLIDPDQPNVVPLFATTRLHVAAALDFPLAD